MDDQINTPSFESKQIPKLNQEAKPEVAQNPYQDQHPYMASTPKQKKETLVEEHVSNKFNGFLKLLYIIVFLSTFCLGTYLVVKQIASMSLRKNKQVDAEVLIQAAYHPVNWQGFGNVFEPLIKIPVVYPQQGVKNLQFLLDSGALVSSLPREEATNLGYESLADLQRSTFRGYGGTSSFAYKGEMTILVKDEEVTIPVVFTEAVGTKKILGRSGFFQEFSVNFNSKRKVIEIRK